MWFNNALIYQYTLENTTELSNFFAEQALKPCPPHARFVYGWLPAIEDQFIHEITGAASVCMGKEERLLPRGVIEKFLKERVEALETQRGYAVKRAEKAQMAEDIEFELLPKSFCVQKRTFAIMDTINKHLIVNASSSTQASQLTALLRKTIPGIQIEPVQAIDNLSQRFLDWINNPASLPTHLQLASDCLLCSPDDEKKRFQCKGYELPADEVLALLNQGLIPAEISLIWNERIQFTLTHDFVFKKLKCLDYLADDFNEIGQLDEEYEQKDAALMLLIGEFRALLQDLLQQKPETINEQSIELV